jgi:twitching motility protein PilT
MEPAIQSPTPQTSASTIPPGYSLAPQVEEAPPPASPAVDDEAIVDEAQVADMESLLHYVINCGGSDLHIAVGVPPMVRLHGHLVPVPGVAVMTPPATRKLVHSIMNVEQRKAFEDEFELDYSFGFKGIGRFRVNAFHQRSSVSAALRLIPTEVPKLEDLGLPPVVATFSELKKGLVLVTGPTGSGKSTTLAAIIDKINRDREEHILTIEDPIEFMHKHKSSVVQQREVGQDTMTFARALKSALREDPDVVLIGEMRDLETISAAVSTAETGHLVFGTLHTNSAAQSIDRMIDVFPSHQQAQIRMQLSTSLQAIVSQRLVPKVGGGRVCALEVLVATPAIRNLIREGKSHFIESSMQSGRAEGMILFDDHLAELLRDGTITLETAIAFANDADGFKSMRP